MDLQDGIVWYVINEVWVLLGLSIMFMAEGSDAAWIETGTGEPSTALTDRDGSRLVAMGAILRPATRSMT